MKVQIGYVRHDRYFLCKHYVNADWHMSTAGNRQTFYTKTMADVAATHARKTAAQMCVHHDDGKERTVFVEVVG